MLELYHNDQSSCSQKARLVLAEKGLEWESRHLDLRAGDQQTPEYLKLNPKGVVPTLVDDGRVVRESNVIIEYVDNAWPGPAPLKPADAYGRAMVHLWTKRLDDGHHDIATATLSMGIAFRHQYLSQGKEAADRLIGNIPDPVKRERRRDIIYNGTEGREFRLAVRLWEGLLTDMEAALAAHGGDWIMGDDYTLVDLAYTPYLTRLDHLNALGFIADRPHLQSWYARVRARPSYDTAIGKWDNADYVALMCEKGGEAWPRVKQIVAEL